MWRLLLFCLPLLGCGGPRRPKIPKVDDGADLFKKQFDGQSLASITVDHIEFDFITWLTVAGGFFVVGAAIVFLWTPKKITASRMLFTGISLITMAKMWLYLKENPWVFWAMVGSTILIYCMMHKKVIEKVVYSLTGILVDWDGDGMSGTGRTAKPVGEKIWWIFRRKTKTLPGPSPASSPVVENISCDDTKAAPFDQDPTPVINPIVPSDGELDTVPTHTHTDKP